MWVREGAPTGMDFFPNFLLMVKGERTHIGVE